VRTRGLWNQCVTEVPAGHPPQWGGWVSVRLVMLILATAGTFATSSSAAEGELAESLRRPIRAVRNVTFLKLESEEIKADVYRPDDDQQRPAVMLIHGGAWSSGDKWNMADHARELAQAGFVAVPINYRLAPTWRFPAQIDDCRAALLWMLDAADTYGIDRQRLAVYGYSAGGHLAALLGTNPPEMDGTIRAVVAGGAPCDFGFIPERGQAIAHVMGGTRAQVPDTYRQASPLTYASGKEPPFFFFHGTADIVVPMASSRALADQLAGLGVETDFHVVPEAGHMVTFIHPSARRAAIEFLDKHLKQDR
jgi:acetyl esterase/lipase